MAAQKSESSSESGLYAVEEPEDTPTKVRSELMRWAAHDLKLRYQRINQDIKYWEGLHTSNLLDKHRKQFDGVKKFIGFEHNDVKRVATKNRVNEKMELTTSLSQAVARVMAFRTEIDEGVIPEDISGKLNFYKDQADRLLSLGMEGKPGFQVSWGHFRTAIEQRIVPQYHSFLEKVDVIARDCYYPLLKALEVLTKQKLDRHGWLSPMSVLEFARFYRILSTREGPVPYIFVPFDRMDSVWNLCAIHHEVGHDFFHKLEHFPGLETSIQVKRDKLSRGDNPLTSTPGEYFRRNVQRYLEAKMKDISLTEKEDIVLRLVGRETYPQWLEEVFADMIGVMLAGPVYINSLQQILLDETATDFVSNDYPPTYIRILLNLIFAEHALKCNAKELNNLGDRWDTLFSLDKQVVEIRRKVKEQLDKPKVFDFAHAGRIPRTLDAQEITTDTLESSLKKWLPLLVEACWQADLAPNPHHRTAVNLRNIFSQIVLLELNDETEQAQLLENERKVYRKYWLRVNKDIKRAQKELAALKRASCRPRHLVPAVRLAFEEKVLKGDGDQWAEKIGRIFADSVIELSEVANEFEQLEQDFADQGWSYRRLFNNRQSEVSNYPKYLKRRF